MTANGTDPDISPLVRQYFGTGLTNTEILQLLRTEHNITISERTLRRRMSELNLRRRSIPYDSNELRNAVTHEVESTGQNLGYRAMRTRLQASYGINVPANVVRAELLQVDPAGVENRTTATIHRRVYHNKGPNYLIHLDGYDKLKKFGLCVHGGIDGYSKKVLWLKGCHSNNNPTYMAYYFTQYIKEIQGVPRCIRMDRGTENTMIEDIQACFRARHTDDMANNAVLYGSSNHNQPIERWWRTCRQMGIQHFMDFFNTLEAQGHLESGNDMDLNCVRFCFLHLLTSQLDSIRLEWNSHRRRLQDHDAGGIPNALYSHPELRGDFDYKTRVDDDDIDEVMRLCYPPLERGCEPAVVNELNNLVTNLRGCVITPCSLEAGRELYLQMRTALNANLSTT